MSSSENGKFAHIDGRVVTSFLRRVHPTKTAEHVSARTGVAADTFRKWEGGSAPSFATALKLIAAYGPAFLKEVMPERLDWLEDAAMAACEAALEEEIKARQAKLAELRKRL